jgi:hypothetical protein
VVQVDTTATLESFRRFLINSTCLSFIPESYLKDEEVFPEKDSEAGGAIYVEAADKVTLKKIRDITFINARDVLGIIYVSKSGNSRLKWRQVRGKVGRVTGEASANSLVNLFTARVLTKEYVEKLLGRPLTLQEEGAGSPTASRRRGGSTSRRHRRVAQTDRAPGA